LALAALVDITSAREAVLGRLGTLGAGSELVFVEPFADAIPAKTEIEISRLTERLAINAVIIATPPEWHRPWVEFALRRGISVLFDKPVTSRTHAVSDPVQAKGIFGDFLAIDREYTKAKGRGRVCALVNKRHTKCEVGSELVGSQPGKRNACIGEPEDWDDGERHPRVQAVLQPVQR
jgi:hypothetical protein